MAARPNVPMSPCEERWGTLGRALGARNAKWRMEQASCLPGGMGYAAWGVAWRADLPVMGRGGWVERPILSMARMQMLFCLI